MQIVRRSSRDASQPIPFNANSVVTVGTFDGVHCGHQGIIRRMKDVAQQTDSRVVVVTFDPHPQIVLHKAGKPPVRLLSTINERCAEFERLGVDLVVVIPFTTDFAQLSAEDFVTQVIVQDIGVRHFAIGYDHKFGKDRHGDEALLQKLGPMHGFTVEWIEPLACDSVVVSSTRIRQALLEGDVEGAARMLGRPYDLTGRVVRGDGRGRSVGFPTANIHVDDPHKLLPGRGVYAVVVHWNGDAYRGMANIGVRPTFTDGSEQTLEVHLLQTPDLNLYDHSVRVQFQHFLRPEQKFSSAEEFVAQLERDKQRTLNFQTTL
jgi:riboflavin kinase/FMN adenylyltransferase